MPERVQNNDPFRAVSQNESERVACLRSYGILDTPPERAFDELSRLAGQICQAPMAAVALLDENRVWFKSRIGIAEPEIPRQNSICQELASQTGILIIPDILADPQWAENPLARSDPNLRFYAGIPLINASGFALGSFCVMDRKPRALDASQAEGLAILSRQVMTQLELRKGLSELSRTLADQKRIESALQDSETFYHSLVETIPQNIFRKDLAGRFTFANRRFCTGLGRTMEEIIGKTDFDFFPKEMALKYKRDDQRIISTRQCLDTVEAHQTQGGEKIHVHVVKTPILDAQGDVIGIQGIFWDVTERKRIEAALAFERDLMRTLLENCPDSIYFKDAQSRFIKCSSSLAMRFQLDDPELVVGKTDSDFFTGEHAQPALEDEQQIIRTGQPIIDKPERETWASGTETWALTSKMPIRNKDNVIIGTFGISKDITALKRAQDDLQIARDAALESARLKSEFLANMSHEIRTPMNALIGMSEMLLNTGLTAEQREFAETARSSAEALLAIINDILDFSKIEAGKLVVECIDFQLAQMVEEAVEFVANRARNKGLELASWTHPDLPSRLRGDPNRIRQILVNFLSNAVKFTHAGEIILRVVLESKSTGGYVLNFNVQDTGIGISEEAQTRIFQPFVQADGSTTRRYGGTGLGLAICRQLAELMNGEVGLQSAPQQGSTFWLTVPLLEAESPDQRDSLSLAQENLHGLRVLIVDDNATHRQIVNQQTRSWGMRNAEAASGPEAIEKLRGAAAQGDPFQVMILDQNMPVMDGLTVALTARGDPAISRTRTLIMTSLGDKPDATLLKLANIGAWLVKPVKQSRLFDSLVSLIENQDLQKSESPPPPCASSLAAQEIKRLPAPRSIRILLAEDNPVNQRVALLQLRKLGYSAEVANDGRQALDAMCRKPFDVVLLDCQMPELDGYEVASKFREHQGAQGAPPPRRCYVIALTAHALEGDREKCLAAGMDDYLTKPVQMGNLDAALERAGKWLAQTGINDGGQRPPGMAPSPLSGLAALSDSDHPESICELFDVFLQDGQSRLQQLAKSMGPADAKVFINSAHSFKGSSSNIGALQLAAFCAQLEKQAKAGQWDLTGPTLEQVEKEFSLVAALLLQEKHRLLALASTGPAKP